MSGHSKWASIKHKKAATDSKRGKVFTKLIKELTVAARSGGGNPDNNPSLRTAIDRAKGSNMPANNIERAIKKGTGELPGVTYEQITYEGYGQSGVAILVESLSDNKNRTTAEIRNIFAKKGGNMAGAGSVNWMFEKKGFFVINKSTIGEDDLMALALEAGADDFSAEGDTYEIKTQPNDYYKVKKDLEDKGVKIEASDLTMIPKSTVALAGDTARQLLALVNELEDHDDVQQVYANFDIPDDVINEADVAG